VSSGSKRESKFSVNARCYSYLGKRLLIRVLRQASTSASKLSLLSFRMALSAESIGGMGVKWRKSGEISASSDDAIS